MRRRAFAIGFVVVVTAAAYAPNLDFDFVNWDDEGHLVRNPTVVGGGTWRDALLTPALGYPAPVTVLSYRIEHALFGLTPGPYHATNVLLHLAALILVARLGRRLGLAPLGAVAAAAVFGLHPASAEVVSWVSGRKDLLATLLGLAATDVFLSRARHHAALAAGLLLLAAAAKPTVIVLPAWWLLFRWRGAGGPPRPFKLAAREVLGGLAVALAVFVFALVGQARVGAVRSVGGLGPWLRELWYALGHHLGLLVGAHTYLPKHIPERMPPPFTAAVDLAPLVGAAIVLPIGRALSPERRRTAALGLAMAALAYAPSSNAIPLARFLADTYLYLPLVGVGVALGAVADEIAAWVASHPATLRPARVVAIAATVALGAFTTTVAAKWHDGLALWQSAWRAYPDSPQVCRSLANAHAEFRDPDGAIATYRECARRFGWPLFEKNHAVILFLAGRRAEACPLFAEMATRRAEDPVIARYHAACTQGGAP